MTKNQLDSRGNRKEGWGQNEKRGNRVYNPPLGWTGIGLKVWDKYENNIWIGMNNSPGEWCVAYHGVGGGQDSENVKQIIGLICESSFTKGSRQAHKNCPDLNHPGKPEGEGVYCTPNIDKTIVRGNKYAGTSEINGKKYNTVLMVRVNPDKIRFCNCMDKEYWVVNGSTDEIRPYRILYKEIKEDINYI